MSLVYGAVRRTLRVSGGRARAHRQHGDQVLVQEHAIAARQVHEVVRERVLVALPPVRQAHLRAPAAPGIGPALCLIRRATAALPGKHRARSSYSALHRRLCTV